MEADPPLVYVEFKWSTLKYTRLLRRLQIYESDIEEGGPVYWFKSMGIQSHRLTTYILQSVAMLIYANIAIGWISISTLCTTMRRDWFVPKNISNSLYQQTAYPLLYQVSQLLKETCLDSNQHQNSQHLLRSVQPVS